MEKNNSGMEEKHLTLSNGVCVTLHYAEDGPSLQTCMLSILWAHMAKK